MKKSIISEIKEENSRIRVLFATSALGMGVNAPYVEHIIHISPPSNLESYMAPIDNRYTFKYSEGITLVK